MDAVAQVRAARNSAQTPLALSNFRPPVVVAGSHGGYGEQQRGQCDRRVS